MKRLFKKSTFDYPKKALFVRLLFISVFLTSSYSQNDTSLAGNWHSLSSMPGQNFTADFSSLNREKEQESEKITIKLLTEMNPATFWREIHLNEKALHSLETKFRSFKSLEGLFQFLNDQLGALKKPKLVRSDFEQKALYKKDGMPLIRINSKHQIMLTSLNDEYLGYLSTNRLAQSLVDHRELENYLQSFTSVVEECLNKKSLKAKVSSKRSTKAVHYFLEQRGTSNNLLEQKNTNRQTLSIEFSTSLVKLENILLLARILEMRATLKAAQETTNVYGLPQSYSHSSNIALSQLHSNSDSTSIKKSQDFLGGMHLDVNEQKSSLTFSVLEKESSNLAEEIHFIRSLATNIDQLRGKAFKPEAIDSIDSKRGPLLPSLVLLSNILRERRDLNHFGVVESFRKQFEIEGRQTAVQKGVKLCEYNDKLIMAMLNSFKTLEIPKILANPNIFIRGN